MEELHVFHCLFKFIFFMPNKVFGSLLIGLSLIALSTGLLVKEGDSINKEVVESCGLVGIQSAEFNTDQVLLILCNGSDTIEKVPLGTKRIFMTRDIVGGVPVLVDRVIVISPEGKQLFSLAKGERWP